MEKLKSDEGFEERLKIQKVAFLLKHLGVAPFTKYNFSMYLRGPYSPDLAREYYEATSGRPAPPRKGWSGKREELLRWFADYDPRWLEVASSIILIGKRYGRINRRETYSILRMSKPWIDRETFEKIASELEERDLL